MKNKIVLSADTKFIDKELWRLVEKLDAKVDRINERTKNHTRYIKQLEKKVKELEVSDR